MSSLCPRQTFSTVHVALNMGSPQAARKQAKLLLKRLKECQLLDVILTPSTVWEMKYMLKSLSRVVTVKVMADETFKNPVHVPRHKLPQFIVSQLEAQKLISLGSPRVPINPPLFLAISSLPEQDTINSSRVHPTLLSWHTPETHRSYWLFACLEIEMPGTGTYTVEELLALRNSSSPKVEDCLSRLARQEPDLSKSALASSLVRPTPWLIVISPQSEDVLRAKQGDILRTINIGSTTNPSAKRAARGRVDTPASHVIKEQLSLSQHQVQQQQQNVPQPTRAWNTTEASSADPVPKPADLAPQEVKGFKKFYKAVVSPSHVRVTAGGRIVPNNRAPSSPTPKATRPNHGIPGTAAFANTNPPPFAVNGTLPPVRPHTNAYSTLPTPASQVLPQLPTQIGYLPTDHGWVQIPIAFAPPGCAVMRSPYSHGSGNLFAPGQNIEKDKGSAADHTNVSTLHGPVVLPGPYINQVPSQPSFALPQVGGSMPSRRNQSPNSVARGSGYHPSMMMGTALSSALNLTMSNPVQPHVPPASSIKASDITKCHIKRMKEVIKYNEDQIHLNKHQVDEKALREQNEQVKALIETFRKTCEMQVKVEDNFLAKDHRDSSSGRPDRSDDMPNSHALERDSTHTESTTLSDVNDGAVRDVPDHTGYTSQTSGSVSSGFPLGQVQDLCSSTMSGAEGSFHSAQVPVHSIDPIKRPSWTSLPRAAAAAAPFQPRRDLAPADRGYCAGQLNPGAGQEQRFGDHTARTFATARSEKHVSFRAEGGNASQGLGTPYLVGQLPPGRNPRDGFVYNRELTDEEKQSRYLY